MHFIGKCRAYRYNGLSQALSVVTKTRKEFDFYLQSCTLHQISPLYSRQLRTLYNTILILYHSNIIPLKDPSHASDGTYDLLKMLDLNDLLVHRFDEESLFDEMEVKLYQTIDACQYASKVESDVILQYPQGGDIDTSLPNKMILQQPLIARQLGLDIVILHTIMDNINHQQNVLEKYQRSVLEDERHWLSSRQKSHSGGGGDDDDNNRANKRHYPLSLHPIIMSYLRQVYLYYMRTLYSLLTIH